MTVVATDTIAGIDVQIHAMSSGVWEIVTLAEDGVRGERIGFGDTLDKAKNQARTWAAKRKVKVAVSFFSPESGQAGVATALHVKNRSVLARYDDGDTDQIAFHKKVLRGDTPREKIEELLAAKQEALRLTRRAKEIEAEFALSLGNAVERAIEDKIAAQEAAS